MTAKATIREALLLMNSMIYCGEDHTQQSKDSFNQALNALDKLKEPGDLSCTLSSKEH